MAPILAILAPLIVLISLGSALAHIRFLGVTFIADLNKLAFWVALPALIFTSASSESHAGLPIWPLYAVMMTGTILISFLAWGMSYALGMPDGARGTLMQSAFRGNLAYIGLPVLTNSFETLPAPAARQAMATSVVVMVLTMASYNILAVIVLQASQHSLRKMNLGRLARSIGTNPLMLAGLLGLLVPLLGITLPSFLNKALQSLGQAAVPLALLCIGGSLVMVPLRGSLTRIATAAALKVAILPVLVFGLCHLAGLGAQEIHIALVLAASPTAAAAFVMAKQMGGDEALASGSIALSTVLSAFSLAAVLWVGS